MGFIYTKGQTTTDDIIEHILMRLNTDFVGGCLQVPDFCDTESDYDHIMEMKVRAKMYKHGVAERCDGTGQPDTAIMLTAKGADVFESGGWRKYLVEYDKQQKAEQERANQKQNTINVNAPIIGSQVGQSSDFGDLELNHNSIALDATDHTPKAKKDDQNIQELTIWNKIYKWTDHKLISGIILLLLGFLANQLLHWLGLIPCP